MGEASGMAVNGANAEGQIDGNNGSEQPEGYSSDDSVRGVHFDDSEEERTIGLDDGFDVGEVVQRRIRPKSIAKKRSSVKKFRKKLPIRRNDNVTGEGSRGHEAGQDDGDVGDGGRRGDEPVQIEPGSGEGSMDDDGPVQNDNVTREDSRDDDGPVQNDNVTSEGSRDDDGPVQNDNVTGEGSRDDDGPVQNANLTGEGYMHGEPMFGEGNRDNGPEPIHELEENYVSEELNSDDPDLDSDEAERTVDAQPDENVVADPQPDAQLGAAAQSQPAAAAQSQADAGAQSQPLDVVGAQSQPIRPVRRRRAPGGAQSQAAAGAQSQPLRPVRRRRVETQSAAAIPTTQPSTSNVNHNRPQVGRKNTRSQASQNGQRVQRNATARINVEQPAAASSTTVVPPTPTVPTVVPNIEESLASLMPTLTENMSNMEKWQTQIQGNGNSGD
ncbi:hypothetical protein SESBI_37239 [Sesbania bispinosa]|nr:hypothetical protein SESBI_37239 [Sesbania bispinosa]